MAVAYEELEGSPSIDMDRHGGAATRIVKIAWDDINAFFGELFPDPWLGYAGSAFFPGYEWLRVNKAKVEPFYPENPSGMGEPMNVYPNGARVTVSYTNPFEDQGQQGGPNGDHSGPGGSKGSSGGQQGQDQAFVTHKVSLGGQFITWPNNGLRWALAANGLTNQPDKEYAVGGETQVGVLLGQLEHTISWHFVPWPPWTVIRQCIGKVNAYSLAGSPRTCLLFLGAEVSREITNAGVKAWTLDYKFSEKNQNALNPLRPQGWQHFLRPDGVNAGTFQEIWKKVPMITIPGTPFIEGTQAGTPPVRQFPQTTLAAALGANDVFVQLTDGSQFPKYGQFRVMVDPVDPSFVGPLGTPYEELAILTGQGTNTWGVLRGVDGTRIGPHAAGVKVIQYPGRVYDEADFRYLFTPGMVF